MHVHAFLWECVCVCMHVFVPYFFDQMPRLLHIFSLMYILVQQLFDSGVYFVGRPADINDDWIR